LVVRILIGPYLTCRRTYAPSSISSLNVPEALMRSGCPLQH
jgi:hypothetical protein